MSNRFTEAAAIAFFALMLDGCASGGGTATPADRSAMETAAETTAATAAKRRGWLPGTGGLFGGRAADKAEGQADAVTEVPRVTGRNAADFEQAVDLMKAEQWTEAEVVLRRITTDQPELAGPWLNLGQVYLKLEQPEEARLAFRQAIAANPENCAAYNQLGVLFRTQGQFTEAEAQYLECLKSSPDFADVYLNLGILYELYLGRLSEALEAYRRYQVLVPEPDRKVAGWVMDLERRTRN